jgi:hypothetical protein
VKLTAPDHESQRAIYPHRRRANIWDRRKLSRISKARHGNHFVADDDAGRAMLTALLHCGLRAEDAMERAPWLDPTELPALRREARKFAFDDIGPLIGLTYAERERLKAWRFWPSDVPREEVARRQSRCEAEKSRERQRKHRRKLRDERERMRDEPNREEAVLEMLQLEEPWPRRSGCCPPHLVRLLDGWITMPALVAMARYCRAFRRPDGRPLRNLRDAVRVALRRLHEQGKVELSERDGKRGRIILARLSGAENYCERDTFPDCRSVGGGLEARTAGGARTSAVNGASGGVSRSHMRRDSHSRRAVCAASARPNGDGREYGGKLWPSEQRSVSQERGIPADEADAARKANTRESGVDRSVHSRSVQFATAAVAFTVTSHLVADTHHLTVGGAP